MKLHPIFTSGMVFAAGKAIRIFGQGRGNITVYLNGETVNQICTCEKWLVQLPPMPEGGPYDCVIDMNGKRIVLQDVYIGTVVLFAGQSNMQFKLSESLTPDTMRESIPSLRLFSTNRMEQNEPYGMADGWLRCSRVNIDSWSAIAYLTGRALTKTHPTSAVGTIACYQGASVIESWLPEGALAACGIVVPAAKKHIDHTHLPYAAWNGDGVLYRYALSQVIPFSLSAIVWYQGESDTTEAEGVVYDKELCLLIDRWRQDFDDPVLPFILIQIADYLPRNDSGWKAVQIAQTRVPQMRENVYMVVSADVCEKDNIHPPTKLYLAQRVADLLQF